MLLKNLWICIFQYLITENFLYFKNCLIIASALLIHFKAEARVYKEVTQLSDFFVTTTISLHEKLLSHRDVLFFYMEFAGYHWLNVSCVP
jgi:hypothetical protein